MDTPRKPFLEELQALEEPTKTKVLIVSTVILMIIVIYFWLAYFNGIISGPAQSTISDQDQQGAPPIASGADTSASSNQGFWSNVGNGTAIVGQSVGGAIQWIGQVFEKPREYIIKPK